MKKFILATCLIIGLAAIRIVQGDEKPVVIEVVLHDKVKVRQPRNIVPLPVCRYNGFNNSVVVEFPDEDVSFTAMVVNTSTGEQWFEMGNGYVEIIISNTPGNYVIEIETDFGRSFQGNFTLYGPIME